jgi:hypothetical protein
MRMIDFLSEHTYAAAGMLLSMAASFMVRATGEPEPD